MCAMIRKAYFDWSCMYGDLLQMFMSYDAQFQVRITKHMDSYRFEECIDLSEIPLKVSVFRIGWLSYMSKYID